MTVENYNENNQQLIMDFIMRIPSIKEIEKDIKDKIVILRDNDEIKGIVSYEIYEEKGLIRYFIFQKDVTMDDLKLLFEQVVENAKKDSLTVLISIIEQKELIDFFSKLEFNIFPVADIYIEELPLINTSYYKATGMLYKIKK